jgi:hypothetical protein
MLETLFADANFKNKNILILGAPRSGTHALASVIYKQDPSLRYIGECGMIQTKESPWDDFDLFTSNDHRRLGHIVQSYTKLFALHKTQNIKNNSLVVELRRRNKVQQFASWMYFKHLGEIYNFQHNGQDYLAPGSLTVTLNDIERFLVDQLVDRFFNPDYILYYEDLNLANSKIKKNHYVYPIEQVFSNLEFVEHWLKDWEYNDQ